MSKIDVLSVPIKLLFRQKKFVFFQELYIQLFALWMKYKDEMVEIT